jgi:gliding motility-associated-like protein
MRNIAFPSFAWKNTLLLFLVLSCLQSYTQKSPLTIRSVTNCPKSERQADIWYFGEHAGIEFLDGNAIPLNNENVMVSYKSSAVISDSTGNLLFFTDGKSVWDRTFNNLPYSPSLEGDLGVTQPCLIIPKPGDANLYYIFTVDVLAYMPDNSYETNGLKYSIVDMRLNKGNGNGTNDWNVPLLSPVSQKLTAVYHQNKKDVWIITHKWNSDEFYAYLLTPQGLGDPVISKSGGVQSGDYLTQNNAWGYMKASPDGSKLALAITGTNTVELYNFDHVTGTVSNPQTYTFAYPGVAPYGIEFSQDSRKVYTTLLAIGNGAPTFPSRIFQFDLNSGFGSPVALDSVSGIRWGGIQLATDGRIYVSRTVNVPNRKDSLDVIYNPTRPGTDCNYNLLGNAPQSRFSLNGGKSIYGLPDFMQSYFERPIFTHDSVCDGDVSRFEITNKANIDSVYWEFGDGATSTQLSPTHLYAQPGNYKVRLTESFNGKHFPDSVMVTIYKKPSVNLGDTILAYNGASIRLHAGGGFMEYQWNTGSGDSIITVESGGNYWVTVKDYNCCINSDSVYVNVFQFYVPTAFAPDGVNKIFKAISVYKNIDFMMYIYDRWGQLVFQSNNIDKGWDGTMGGQKCMPETYAWVIYIDFLGNDIITNGKIVLKGTVTLVR